MPREPDDERDDEALIREHLDDRDGPRGRAAFGVLVDRWSERVYRWAWRVVREREAAQIEYLADELCLAWLLEDELFERGWEAAWDGEIIGLINSGLFVRFGDVFEGFLPARRLHGDYFEANERGTALAGRRGGRTFRLGDPIRVRVERVDRAEGKVELSRAG
jgi:ribonuclease R